MDLNGNYIGKLEIPNSTNRDWEAIALAPCRFHPEKDCLFVGDIGGNIQIAKRIDVYQIKEPTREELINGGKIYANKMSYDYPDDGGDAEAMIIDRNQFIIIR